MGKSALEGLKGIHKVKNGWRGSREINTVIYQPELITPEEMISALKKTGTYIGIAEE